MKLRLNFLENDSNPLVMLNILASELIKIWTGNIILMILQ